jgi:hypothetical protein
VPAVVAPAIWASENAVTPALAFSVPPLIVTVLAAALDSLDTKTDNTALKSFEIDPAVLRERFVTQMKDGATKNGDAATAPTK